MFFIISTALFWFYFIVAIATMFSAILNRATASHYKTEPTFAEVMFMVIEAFMWPAFAAFFYIKSLGVK